MSTVHATEELYACTESRRFRSSSSLPCCERSQNPRLALGEEAEDRCLMLTAASHLILPVQCEAPPCRQGLILLPLASRLLRWLTS